MASGPILRLADWCHRFDRCNPLDLHLGPGRADRHDELRGGLLGLRLVVRPRLSRTARGRCVDLLETDLGLDELAGALLLLAIINIRNAWDLTLTMVRRHR